MVEAHGNFAIRAKNMAIKALEQTEDINEIIKRCEDTQDEDISDYHKDRAKIFAYDEIVKIWKGR